MTEVVNLFPGAPKEQPKNREALAATLDDLSKCLAEQKDKMRAAAFVIFTDDDDVKVSYGGEFSSHELIGILETIKMELMLRGYMEAPR
jgi:hypothetical protein